MIGIPGLALAFVWAVVLPIADYHRPAEDDCGTAALRLLFLRVCLYGVYASCFESSIFQQVGAVWFFFVISAFGLRYLSVMRVSA
jgi:O-antigen ligase